MSERIITTMEYEEFQALTYAYIERSSQEYSEIPASVFFELLFERMAEGMAASSDPQNPNSLKPPTSR